MASPSDELFDVFIIGGGINGCGIARDAAGRGLRVGLAEMNDLASATSSASTKLFHGGLRYLEYFEFRLVREALREREVLLRAMPHIAWPMRFVLPLSDDMRFDNETPTSRVLTRLLPWAKGRRPAWLIRLGLFLYDHLGGRDILPGTRSVDLTRAAEGVPLHNKYKRAFEYSDVWVQDARLVALNARDAAERGAQIRTRTRVIGAERNADHWRVALEDTETGACRQIRTRLLVNAAGPWVSQTLTDVLGVHSPARIRLVRGSHIVTRKLFDHDRAYFFQGEDGRIIFAIPYEGDFTLVGTTDADHEAADTAPVCSEAERDYLLRFASQYFERRLAAADVVWSFAGVRPLFDDGAEAAAAATRDYAIKLDQSAAPLLNIFGGKITTYRRLAETACAQINAALDHDAAPWTATAALPGGAFDLNTLPDLITRFAQDHVCKPAQASAWIHRYGTEAWDVFAGTPLRDQPRVAGTTILEAEAKWLCRHEFARTAEDILWRRTKLGLTTSAAEAEALESWIKSHQNLRAAS